jgi:hypothetical protein
MHNAHKILIASGILLILFAEYMIVMNTFTTGVNDPEAEGGFRIIKVETIVPFWVYPLLYIGGTITTIGLMRALACPEIGLRWF